jgi:hypothetical protein
MRVGGGWPAGDQFERDMLRRAIPRPDSIARARAWRRGSGARSGSPSGRGRGRRDRAWSIRLLLDHRQGGVTLGVAVGLRQAGIDDLGLAPPTSAVDLT